MSEERGFQTAKSERDWHQLKLQVLVVLAFIVAFVFAVLAAGSPA